VLVYGERFTDGEPAARARRAGSRCRLDDADGAEGPPRPAPSRRTLGVVAIAAGAFALGVALTALFVRARRRPGSSRRGERPAGAHAHRGASADAPFQTLAAALAEARPATSSRCARDLSRGAGAA
jgi:hypothetical protein